MEAFEGGMLNASLLHLFTSLPVKERSPEREKVMT